jgi:divalent metal cation (Fe/Co/Zn/Cd) transporter
VNDVAFGHTALPPKQTKALRRAIRLEWITIGFLVVAVTLVGLVLGNSQAMKVAWVEDLLSLLPPIAFLVTVRVIRKPPSRERPYGYHRSVGVAHLVAAVTLVVMGTLLIIDSGWNLITAEHPSIGSVELFGQGVLAGLADDRCNGADRRTTGAARPGEDETRRDLHDKVLYADADLNKADWMTALGTIIGVSGIGVGLWWTDAVAALFISFMILHDG